MKPNWQPSTSDLEILATAAMARMSVEWTAKRLGISPRTLTAFAQQLANGRVPPAAKAESIEASEAKARQTTPPPHGNSWVSKKLRMLDGHHGKQHDQ